MNKKNLILTIVISIELMIILYLSHFFYSYPFRSTGLLIKHSTDLQILDSRLQSYPDLDSLIPQFPPQYLIKSNNTKMFSELIPNFEQKYDGTVVKLDRITHVKINSDGFRDREFLIEKSNNTIRIIFLGDSFVFGTGLELNETIPKLLEKKLNNISIEKNFEVLNFGIPGYSTLNEIELLKVKGLKYNPDFIIIGYFHNDMLDNSRILERVNDKLYEKFNGTPNMSDQNIYREVLKIHVDIINDEEENVLQSSFDDFWKKNVEIPLEDLNKITKEKNITVIIVNVVPFVHPIPYASEQLELLENISKKYGWYFINLNDEFSKYSWSQLTLNSVDQHLNPQGSSVVATSIFKFIAEKNLLINKSQLFNYN